MLIRPSDQDIIPLWPSDDSRSPCPLSHALATAEEEKTAIEKKIQASPSQLLSIGRSCNTGEQAPPSPDPRSPSFPILTFESPMIQPHCNLQLLMQLKRGPLNPLILHVQTIRWIMRRCIAKSSNQIRGVEELWQTNGAPLFNSLTLLDFVAASQPLLSSRYRQVINIIFLISVLF